MPSQKEIATGACDGEDSFGLEFASQSKSNHLSTVPDPQSAADYETWLKSNRSLRMDANNPNFKENRRRLHLSRYEFACKYARGLRVLDAACGTGYGSALMADHASQVDGVDISGETVQWANKTYGDAKTAFHKACVEFVPFEDSAFDLVVSFETLEHTLSPQSAVWEFVRVMKPGGTGIFSVPNAWGLTEHHFVDFNQPLFEELLGRCFGKYELFYNNSGSRKSKIAGTGPLASLSQGAAECIIGVCREPRKACIPADQRDFWTSEIYENVFRRHRQYLKLRNSLQKILNE